MEYTNSQHPYKRLQVEFHFSYWEQLKAYVQTRSSLMMLRDFFITALLLACLQPLFFTGPHGSKSPLLLAIGLSLIATVGMYLLHFLLVAVVLFRARRNSFWTAPVIYQFDEEGVYFKSKTIDVAFKWAAFAKISQRKNFLYFFVSRKQFHAIPTEKLKAAGILQSVHALIQEQTNTQILPGC